MDGWIGLIELHFLAGPINPHFSYLREFTADRLIDNRQSNKTQSTKGLVFYF